MTVADEVADLAAAGSLVLHEPADLFDDAMLGVQLPADHLRLLARSNGIEAYGGYYRLFAVGGEAAIEMRRWNEPGLWRYAWRGRVDGYLCFGESAWGDQYAYAIGERSGSVHRLDAFSMESESIAASFTEFMRCVFLTAARHPCDELTVATRARLGRLPLAEHVTMLPPPRSGDLDPTRVVRMAAAPAMVANAEARAAPAHRV